MSKLKVINRCFDCLDFQVNKGLIKCMLTNNEIQDPHNIPANCPLPDAPKPEGVE